MKPESILNEVLETIFKTKKTKDLSGNIREVNDMISRDEAFALFKMYKASDAKISLEVGLAHGVSALVFCQAHDEYISTEGVHYAVDPNQLTSYNSAAICALEKAGYLKHFKLLNGPSHLEIPELIKQNIKVDCAFIDGWHTFDYTLIDFFLIDKILKPSGYIAFHDTYGRAKQKVINFILTHRKYEIDNTLMNFSTESFYKVLKFFIWRIYKDPMLLFSWFHWQYQLRSSSGLIILKKIEDFEPDYNFFKNF
jgi:predicted O-methyltransferase YrrM